MAYPRPVHFARAGRLACPHPRSAESRLRVRRHAGGRDAPAPPPLPRRDARPLRDLPEPAVASLYSSTSPACRRRCSCSDTSSHCARFYSFRGKDAADLLFAWLCSKIKEWKEFFYLSSSAPWPCSVQLGEPSKSASFEPALTSAKDIAANLLRARGDSFIDLSTCLHESNMNAARIIASPPPPPPPPPRTPKGWTHLSMPR